MRKFVGEILIIILFLEGCSSLGPVEPSLLSHQYASSEISEIQIEMDAGLLTIIGGDGTDIQLSASVAEPDSLEVTQNGLAVFFLLNDPIDRDKMTIQVPAGVVVRVQTFSADVHLLDVRGGVDVSSTAGNIVLDNFLGDALLVAGRGDIDVNGGRGDVVVIGEHGTLSVVGFDGDVSISTIMGTIKYSASGSNDGVVRLESDHGPVEVLLQDDSNTEILVNSTSGIVTCLGQNLVQTVAGCEGIVGAGEGELIVRTVSGRVDLKVLLGNSEGKNE